MKTKSDLILEIARLKSRLDESESLLQAIKDGDVNALSVSKSGEPEVLPLRGTGDICSAFIESMNEGAVAIISDGTIFFINERFVELIKRPSDQLIGKSIQELINTEEGEKDFLTILRSKNNVQGEFQLQPRNSLPVSVQLSSHAL